MAGRRALEWIRMFEGVAVVLVMKYHTFYSSVCINNNTLFPCIISSANQRTKKWESTSSDCHYL